MARQVYGDYGIGGFWNGTAASLVMVINPTLQYALYEWLTAARAKLRWGGLPGGAAGVAALGAVGGRMVEAPCPL